MSNESLVDLAMDQAKQEQRKTLFFYMLFFGSASMLCIPLIYTSLVGLIICLLTLVGIYSTRSDAEEDGYVESHMTFLIHTFWYAALFMFYSAVAAGLYMLGFAQYLEFFSCAQTMGDAAVNAVKYASINGIIESADLCWRVFLEKNQIHITISAIIALAPIFMYLVYRFVRGWTIAVKHNVIKL